MTPERRRQLRAAPETPLLEILTVAITRLQEQLDVEHATLDDPTPDDPRTLILARRLRGSARRLVGDVRRYQKAIRALLKSPPPPNYPF